MEKSMFYGATPIIFQRAKELRNRMTFEESILWEQLKGKKLGVRFRRQHPISAYIVDFYCHQANLVIEVDGSIHNLPHHKIEDKKRQQDLENLGLNVIRFTNKEVRREIEKVIEKIEKNIV